MEDCVVIDSSSDDEATSSASNQTIQYEQAGIFQECLTFLNEAIMKQQIHPSHCGLMISDLELERKSQFIDGVLYGFERNDNDPIKVPCLASKALIFMVTSLVEKWKIPIGVFFIDSPSVSDIASYIKATLMELHRTQIQVISLTVNCLCPELNFNLATELGAEIDFSTDVVICKPFFTYTYLRPCVFIFYDIESLLELIKQYWMSVGTMSYNNHEIKFKYVSEVNKINDKHLADFPEETRYDWFIMKRRLHYDPDKSGESMINAIKYLKGIKYSDFENSGATIRFLSVLDLIAQLSKMNGSPGEPGLTRLNFGKWERLIEKIINYIEPFLINGANEVITFSTGVTVYLTSLLLVHKEMLKTLPNSSNALLKPTRFSLQHFKLGAIGAIGTKVVTAARVFKKLQALTRSLCIDDIP